LKLKSTWLVVIAVGLAVFSRFYAFGVLPPQIWFDEIWLSLKARLFLQTGAMPVFYKTFWGGVHPLMVLLTAAVQRLGLNALTAPRVVSAVGGVLCIPLTYLCLSELWRDTWTPVRRQATAALAALILSNLLSYVVIGRIGFEPPLAPVFTVGCIWLYHRAQRTGRLAWWTVAGALLGVSQYLSQHMRFLIPLMGLFVLYDGLRCGAGKRKPFIGGVAWFGLAAALVALPLLAFFVREPEWLMARAGIITQTGDQRRWLFLLDNVRRVALSFIVAGSQGTLENLPGRPLFDVLQMVGFVSGLVWAARGWRNSAVSHKPLAWLAIMAAPSILTGQAPSFERMANLMPAAAAVVAIGWAELWQWVGRRVTLARWQRWLIPCSWVLVSLGINAYAYWYRYPLSPTLRTDYTAGTTDLMRQLVERSNTEAVFVQRLTGAENAVFPDFFLPNTAVHYLDFQQCLPLTHQRDVRTTYLVMPKRSPEIAKQLTAAYPQAKVIPFASESEWLLDDMTLIEVPPHTPVSLALSPAQARFEPGLDLLGYTWSGPTVRPGQSVFLTLYWRALADLKADYTALVHVSARSFDAPPIAQRDGQPCQGMYPTSRWRKGDLVPDSFAVTIPTDAPPGEYSLVIGWYSYPSLTRLSLTTAEHPLPEDRAVIATIRVVP
jgi:hypothetical protein